MAKGREPLPYVFDLFCDLKTHRELEQDWNRTKDHLELLETLMKEHGITVKRKTGKKVW